MVTTQKNPTTRTRSTAGGTKTARTKTPTSSSTTPTTTWTIKATTPQGQLYNGTYSAAETRRAIAKIAGMVAKWKGGPLAFAVDGPAMPAMPAMPTATTKRST